jgi:hypothetical protein
LRIGLAAPVELGGGIIPLQSRSPSPFRSFTFDVGYEYTPITRGALPRNGGVIVNLGAPLLFF